MNVIAAGIQTTVQDLGRFGYRHGGVTTAGALDNGALRSANILVGNGRNAAGLEFVAGRARLQFADERLVAWIGGEFNVRVNEEIVPARHTVRVSKNEILELTAHHGRAWLAISGGIDVPLVLGSRSTDLRAHFGGLNGRALRDGDTLSLGHNMGPTDALKAKLKKRVSDWAAPVWNSGIASIRIVPGRQWREHATVFDRFSVSNQSDRMGVRLQGNRINATDEELVSEAVAPGTVQVPRGGSPIILLADCQTIGGYPKLAHVISVDLTKVAQLQAGDSLQFELTTIGAARALLREREQDIERFALGMQMHVA